MSAPGAVAIQSIGTSANFSPRYVRAFGGGSSRLTAGFDWKRSNNNLLFGGQSVFSSSSTVDELSLGYSRGFADRLGSTNAGATLYYSPGGLSAGNSDTAFAAQREGATARYVYLRLDAERLTSLPRGFTWDVRGTGQIADAPLLSSEQLTFGGDGSVRGFVPFATTRDNGVVLNTEVRAPALHPNLPRHVGFADGSGDALVPFAFADYGVGTLHGVAGSLQQLASVGPGLRYQFARYASVSFSYGFIVEHAGLPTSSSGRVQVQVSVNY